MALTPFENTDSKNIVLKRQILEICIDEGEQSIADLSHKLNASIPTITKLVGELMADKFLEDHGKLGTAGGRKPSIYGLNDEAGYFVGTEIRKHSLNIAITDFKGKLIDYFERIEFTLDNTEERFREMCRLVTEHVETYGGIRRASILAYGFTFSGRVNHSTGYSFSYSISDDKPINEILTTILGRPVFIENDSRAMSYGEYVCGVARDTSDMVFFNVGWGLGTGLVLGGKLYYGKSGFSGELGHFAMLDNDVMCRCGKTGCLETGASGSALHRLFTEKLAAGRTSSLSSKYQAEQRISLEDIISAAHKGDVLAIETIEEVGSTLGRAIAGIINIFNPEMVVIGGILAGAKDYLMLPLKSGINRHSLKIVSNDSKVEFSTLGNRGSAIGACMLSRSRLLGLI